MSFIETTHLSEIIEKSDKKPVIIFKYSNNCNSSTRLYEKFKENIKKNKTFPTTFLVTVQDQPVLSEKIEKWFNLKHETPQVIVLKQGKLIYDADHDSIKFENLILK